MSDSIKHKFLLIGILAYALVAQKVQAAPDCEGSTIYQSYLMCAHPNHGRIYNRLSSKACKPIYEPCLPITRARQVIKFGLKKDLEAVKLSKEALIALKGELLVDDPTLKKAIAVMHKLMSRDSADKICKVYTSLDKYRDPLIEGLIAGIDYQLGYKMWENQNAGRGGYNKPIEKPKAVPSMVYSFGSAQLNAGESYIIDDKVEGSYGALFLNDGKGRFDACESVEEVNVHIGEVRPYPECKLLGYEECEDPSHGIASYKLDWSPACPLEDSLELSPVFHPLTALNPTRHKSIKCLTCDDVPEGAGRLDCLMNSLKYLGDPRLSGGPSSQLYTKLLINEKLHAFGSVAAFPPEEKRQVINSLCNSFGGRIERNCVGNMVLKISQEKFDRLSVHSVTNWRDLAKKSLTLFDAEDLVAGLNHAQETNSISELLLQEVMKRKDSEQIYKTAPKLGKVGILNFEASGNLIMLLSQYEVERTFSEIRRRNLEISELLIIRSEIALSQGENVEDILKKIKVAKAFSNEPGKFERLAQLVNESRDNTEQIKSFLRERVTNETEKLLRSNKRVLAELKDFLRAVRSKRSDIAQVHELFDGYFELLNMDGSAFSVIMGRALARTEGVTDRSVLALTLKRLVLYFDAESKVREGTYVVVQKANAGQVEAQNIIGDLLSSSLPGLSAGDDTLVRILNEVADGLRPSATDYNVWADKLKDVIEFGYSRFAKEMSQSIEKVRDAERVLAASL